MEERPTGSSEGPRERAEAVPLAAWLASLASIEVHEVSATLSPRRPCVFESPFSVIVRGLLGEALHARVAPDEFARLFEGTSQATELRPFWLRGLHVRPALDLSDRLTVSLSLLGSEAAARPHFTAALVHALAAAGDPERPPNVVGRPAHRVERLAPEPDEVAGDAVLLTARTPLSLRGDERGAAELCPQCPTLGLLLKAGARRLGAIQRAVDPQAPRPPIEWPDLSAIVAREDTLVPWTGSRFTVAQNQRAPLGGLVGDLLVEGPGVREVLPLLRLLARVSVGRKTAFGFGDLALDVVG